MAPSKPSMRDLINLSETVLVEASYEVADWQNNTDTVVENPPITSVMRMARNATFGAVKATIAHRISSGRAVVFCWSGDALCHSDVMNALAEQGVAARKVADLLIFHDWEKKLRQANPESNDVHTWLHDWKFEDFLTHLRGISAERPIVFFRNQKIDAVAVPQIPLLRAWGCAVLDWRALGNLANQLWA